MDRKPLPCLQVCTLPSVSGLMQSLIFLLAAAPEDNRPFPTMPQRISPRGTAILGCALPRARIHRPRLPLRFFNFQLSTVGLYPVTIGGSDRSGAVRRIDADILRREVAGPIARLGFPRVQVHNQRNVFGEKTVVRGAFVEIQRLPAAQDGNSRHGDIDQRSVKENSGAPGGSEDA